MQPIYKREKLFKKRKNKMQKHYGRKILENIRDAIAGFRLRREPVLYTVSASKSTNWYEVRYMRTNNRNAQIRLSEDSESHIPYTYEADRETSRLLEKAFKYEKQGSDSGVCAWVAKLVEVAEKYRSALPMEQVRVYYKKFGAIPLDGVSADTRSEMNKRLEKATREAQANTFHVGVINRAEMINRYRHSQAFDVVYRDGTKKLQVTTVEHHISDLSNMEYCQNASKVCYKIDSNIRKHIDQIMAAEPQQSGSFLRDLSGYVKTLRQMPSKRKICSL